MFGLGRHPGKRLQRPRSVSRRPNLGDSADSATQRSTYRRWGNRNRLRGGDVDTYVILRRNGWRTAADLQEAAARSTAEGEHMPDDVRWIRSYVTAEPDSSVGTVCIYQASSPEAVRRHALAAVLPVDEIVKVADTVVVRPDPAPVGV
jgi:hypothetical protein